MQPVEPLGIAAQETNLVDGIMHAVKVGKGDEAISLVLGPEGWVLGHLQ